MYRVGYFLILITVLIPISVDYAMQGGLAAGCLLWFAADNLPAGLRRCQPIPSGRYCFIA